MTRLLVAGIGNIFLGDDAFGVEVAQRLMKRPQSDGVRVVDFGIRSFDLALALERCDAAILVDATARGGAPGTLYVLEPDPVVHHLHSRTGDVIGDTTHHLGSETIVAEEDVADAGYQNLGRNRISLSTTCAAS